MPAFTLSHTPGFSDLPDSALVHDQPALGAHIAKISENAAFGMVGLELFQGVYKNGDTVPLPISTVDGYNYQRSELLYVWGIQSTLNPATGWITGPDTLWYAGWKVDQTTGLVSSEEWYVKSDGPSTGKSSTDGTLWVTVVAQRQRSSLILSAAPPTYVDHVSTQFATDKALTQVILQDLNRNSKMSTVGTEVYYLGEFVNAQTVTPPTSPIDGYVYTAKQCRFVHCMRWTTTEGSYVQPDWGLRQLHQFYALVSSAGVVTVTIQYKTGGPVITAPNYGRVAVFVFCDRAMDPTTGAYPAARPAGAGFTELDPGLFAPGSTLRASTMLKLNDNIRQSMVSPEFFGPVEYNDGDTIPLPTSPVDGYTYVRSELAYVWEWRETQHDSSGSHFRLPAIQGSINGTTGVVSLKIWYAGAGVSYGTEPDASDAVIKIRVLVVGTRSKSNPSLTGTSGSTPTGASGSGEGSGGFQVNGV